MQVYGFRLPGLRRTSVEHESQGAGVIQIGGARSGPVVLLGLTCSALSVFFGQDMRTRVGHNAESRGLLMALKPVYVIEGKRWLPIVRAAALLGTNSAIIKKLMGDGILSWQQLRPNSKNLLASEPDVLRLRSELNVSRRETDKRARVATRSAVETGRAQIHHAPWPSRQGCFGVFSPTWEPSAVERPVSGREEAKPERN